MSCPDWPPLLAHRFQPGAEPPADWLVARSHLQSCPTCRAAAAAIDPTVAFHGAAAWVPAAEERAAILHNVRTLRRAGALALTTAVQRLEAQPAPRHRAAAAALFAVLLALLPGSTARRGVDSPDLARLTATVPVVRLAPPSASALEGLDRPQARVYEWGGDDLSVVMVVDESLDV